MTLFDWNIFELLFYGLAAAASIQVMLWWADWLSSKPKNK